MSDRSRTAGTLAELGRCRSCGAYVVFLRQPSGRTPPYDVDVDPLGDAYEIKRDAERRPVSHFSSCPDAASWRGLMKDEPQNANTQIVDP